MTRNIQSSLGIIQTDRSVNYCISYVFLANDILSYYQKSNTSYFKHEKRFCKELPNAAPINVVNIFIVAPATINFSEYYLYPNPVFLSIPIS